MQLCCMAMHCAAMHGLAHCIGPKHLTLVKNKIIIIFNNTSLLITSTASHCHDLGPRAHIIALLCIAKEKYQNNALHCFALQGPTLLRSACPCIAAQ